MTFMALAVIFMRESMADMCQDKSVSPITDICRNCLFPLTLDGILIITVGQGDTDNPDDFLCTCTNPLRIGVKTGLWEPVWRVDVTRIPYCSASLGGIKLDPGIRALEGEIRLQQDNAKQSSYQAHWHADPVFYQLEMILDDPCLETGSFDVACVIEVDSTWSDDELTMLLNPEAFLFGNPIAQATCAGGCVLSSAGFGSNAPFWCAGCQGSTCPLNDHVRTHVLHAQTSSLLVQCMTAKLHHEFLTWGTSGANGLCGTYPGPVVDKTQYRYQMLYPTPQTGKINGYCCQPCGRMTAIWGTGKSCPYTSEDSTYMIFRKKNYCLGVGF